MVEAKTVMKILLGVASETSRQILVELRTFYQ